MKLFLSIITCLVVSLTCMSFGKPVPGKNELIYIMAFNIHHGAPRNSELVSLDDVADAIRAGKAEIVALQEVDKNTERSGNVDQAKALADKLDMHYYFSKSIDYQGGDYGVAVLSKYPIVNSKQIILPNNHPGGEQRTLAYVTLELPDGSKLDFASVHLDLVQENRAEQTQFLVELSKKTDNPLIIAGDFNGEPQHEEIQTLSAAYHPPHEGDWPLTFPSNKPNRTIDYIFSEKKAFEKFGPLVYKALNNQQCSDHLPLLGVFRY